MVAIGGVISLLQRRVQPLIVEGSSQLTELEAAVSQKVVENFQALRLLHNMGQLDEADLQFRASMGKLEKAKRLQTLRMSLLQPISRFLPILAIALIASMSMLLLGGRNSGLLPSLVTFVVALQRLNVQISTIAQTFNKLADNTGRIQRLNEILSSQGKKFRRHGGTPFKTLRRGIRFEAVGLQYSPELPLALREISFNLPRGQTLALVGSSGAGKSSLLICSRVSTLPLLDVWIDEPPRSVGDAKLAAAAGCGQPGHIFVQRHHCRKHRFWYVLLNSCPDRSPCQAAQAADFIEALPRVTIPW